jgi:hypothetical protein
MKSKTQPQVQPPEDPFLQNAQAAEDLLTFQLAVASYGDCVSKEPGVSFYQHLCNFLMNERHS